MIQSIQMIILVQSSNSSCGPGHAMESKRLLQLHNLCHVHGKFAHWFTFNKNLCGYKGKNFQWMDFFLGLVLFIYYLFYISEITRVCPPSITQI